MMNINSPVVVILLAGMLGSTWAVAGDTLTGGTGNLDISLRIGVFDNDTGGSKCEISVAKSSQDLGLIVLSETGDNNHTLPNSFTIKECMNTPMDFKVDFSTPGPSGMYAEGYTGKLCPDSGVSCDSAFLPYNVLIPGHPPGVTGGANVFGGEGGMFVPGNGGSAMTVTPDSNNYTLQADTLFPAAGFKKLTTPGHYSGSYTWTFTYH
ncbi:TPA: hypothetical protein H2R31_004505 [Salmonella enterica]|nr:hypothetical protein [Salmonella enterica]HAK6119396.1 hypothetical protein [Salmonella enterica]